MQDLLELLERYRQSRYIENKVEIAGQIVEAIAGKVWLFLSSRAALGDVDDLRQEVLLAVVTQLDDCNARNQRAFWGWVYRIAANKAANRSNDAAKWVVIEQEEMIRLLEASDKSDGMTRRERADYEEILTALDQLDDRSRSIIWAHLVEGFTFVEIAAAAGKSPAAVRMRCARGLTAARKLLKKKS